MRKANGLRPDRLLNRKLNKKNLLYERRERISDRPMVQVLRDRNRRRQLDC